MTVMILRAYMGPPRLTPRGRRQGLLAAASAVEFQPLDLLVAAVALPAAGLT